MNTLVVYCNPMEMVFDSSTIILLAKIEIIRSIAEDIEVIIPETVKIECLIKDTFEIGDRYHLFCL